MSNFCHITLDPTFYIELTKKTTPKDMSDYFKSHRDKGIVSIYIEGLTKDDDYDQKNPDVLTKLKLKFGITMDKLPDGLSDGKIYNIELDPDKCINKSKINVYYIKDKKGQKISVSLPSVCVGNLTKTQYFYY